MGKTDEMKNIQWTEIDNIICICKAHVYEEIQKKHPEHALRTIRCLIEYCHMEISELAGETNAHAQKQRYELYLNWMRANYFHLTTDRSKAAFFYAKANNLHDEIHRSLNLSVMDNPSFFIRTSLLFFDMGDFYWYSDTSDMAAIFYKKIRNQLDSVSSWQIELPDDPLSLSSAIKQVINQCGVDPSGDDPLEGDFINFEGSDDFERDTSKLIQKKLLFANLKMSTYGFKHSHWDPQPLLDLLQDDFHETDREILFLVGQSLALCGDYSKAARFFLQALLGKKPPESLNRIFPDVSLDEILKDELLKRCASCYFLSKLMQYLPFDWQNDPERKADIKKNDEKMGDIKQEIDLLQSDIRDFINPSNNDPELHRLMSFVWESIKWVGMFYNINPASTPSIEELNKLKRKLAYTLTNAYFFFYDFTNRKKEFKDDLYSKLYTPAVHLIPRSGNFLSVLKRWSSASPMIMRGRKISVSTNNQNRPEEVRDGYDMDCYAQHNPESKGGGYFLRWNDYGIVIDPGIFFFENFLEYFSFDDIDLVIVTHDHPDHQMDMKSLFVLMNESRKERSSLDKQIDFWIDPASCAEFYGYILKLQAQEEQREIDETRSGKELTQKIIGNIYPFYKDISEAQNSPNHENVWEIAEKKITIKTIYNKKHKTIGAPRQSFGVLLRLENDTSGRTIYISGDGGYNNETVRWVKQNIKNLGIDDEPAIDILVAHLGSVIDRDLVDTVKFEKPDLYKTHLGLRGVIELVRELEPGLTVISEFGEELDTHRKRLCTHIDLHRLLFPPRHAKPSMVQTDTSPQHVLPGDIGLTLLFNEKPSSAEAEEPIDDGIYFICKFCFKPQKREKLVIRTSGQTLSYLCKKCNQIFFDETDSPASDVYSDSLLDFGSSS